MLFREAVVHAPPRKAFAVHILIFLCLQISLAFRTGLDIAVHLLELEQATFASKLLSDRFGESIWSLSVAPLRACLLAAQ